MWLILLILSIAFISAVIGFLVGSAFAEEWIREAHYWQMRAEDGEAKAVGGRFSAEVNRG